MSDTSLPQLKTYMPTTFADRGVLVPFTSPRLCGARVRMQSDAGAELLLPMPSGKFGLYVFPLGSIRHLCRATVHDRRMIQRLARVTEVTPSVVRQLAREVAIEGLAGRAAQVAAQTAMQLDEKAQAITSGLLMLALWERLEPQRTDFPSCDAPDDALREAATRSVISHAAQLGIPADELPGCVKQAATAFSGVGIHGSSHRTRVLQSLDMLDRTHRAIAAWSRERPQAEGELACMVAAVAGATVTCTTVALRDARLSTQDAVGLIQRWSGNRSMFCHIAERPEWLLDGWEPICRLWHAAETDSERAATLAEVALRVPVLPKETGEWARITIRADSLFSYRNTVLVREDWRVTGDSPARPQGRRTVQRNEDWRTSSTIDFIARNEHLRSLSA